MKFLNKVIVFVMGIVVLGIVSTLVFNMSQETEKEVVAFEILGSDNLTPGTYDSLYNYLGTTDGNEIPITFEYNGEIYNGRYSNLSNIISIYFQVDIVKDYFFIYDNDTWEQEDPQDIVITTGDKFIFKETVPPQLTGVTSTLLFLAPLILSASLIGFLAFKKGDE